VSVVAAALSGILSIACYRFATESPVPGFDDAGLRNAFRPRPGRGRLS
jgi:hypothetical protein